MVAAKPRITVASEPSGANIEWNGRFVGTTPFSTEVEDYVVTPPKYLWSKFLGEDIVLRVWKDGYLPKTVRLTSGPFVWVNMTNTASKEYYVVAARDVRVVLERLEPVQRTPRDSDAADHATDASPITGTGFVLSRDGYIATNYHVVKNATRIELRLQGQARSLSATVAVKDTRNDLAILRTEKPIQANGAPVTFADPSLVKVGQDVYTLGYPLGDLMGSTVRLSTGTIDSVFGLDDDPRVFQISTPVQPGNSGGPLFNKDGQLVGIVVAQLDAKLLYEAVGIIPQNVNFAVKANFLKNLVDTLPGGGNISTQNALIGQSREKQIEALSPSVVEIVARHEPPARPVITKEIEGLTPDEVRGTFGAPSATDNSGGRAPTWFYETPEGTLSVYYVDGRATLHRPAEPPTNSRAVAAGSGDVTTSSVPAFASTRERWSTSSSDTFAFLTQRGGVVILELTTASTTRGQPESPSRFGAGAVPLHQDGDAWKGLEPSNPNCVGNSTWVLHKVNDVLLLEQQCETSAVGGGRGVTLVLNRVDTSQHQDADQGIASSNEAERRCQEVATHLDQMPGDRLAAKIRAANPGSFKDIGDDRLEAIFRADFPCLAR
ncbi:MAG TPA: trypsin-like peptidase domain-containing protein [Vicinamibacterales bacterium]|nr:trypsin-like peptidase domain-containing protein [Vicinamibacterales bacterium]